MPEALSPLTINNELAAVYSRRLSRQTGAAIEVVRRNAANRAADYADTIADVRAGGALSLSAIATELNDRGIVTPRGGAWHPSSVRNLIARLSACDRARPLLCFFRSDRPYSLAVDGPRRSPLFSRNVLLD